MTPEQIKYMEMVQNIITRMNTNSFQIKGFMMLILSAILVAFVNLENSWVLLSAIPVVVLIWIIDSFYLQHERKFRGLFNDLVKNISSHKLFSMDISSYKNGQYSLVHAMIYSVNGLIYTIILGLIVLIKIVSNI
jgi:hypothetical protein